MTEWQCTGLLSRSLFSKAARVRSPTYPPNIMNFHTRKRLYIEEGQRLFQQLHQHSDEDWHRASGEMTCKYCALKYRQHPLEEMYNIDHRLCQGTIVHL